MLENATPEEELKRKESQIQRKRRWLEGENEEAKKVRLEKEKTTEEASQGTANWG